MSIAHELSCDVAAAMFAEGGRERQADRAQRELTEIVLEVHTTLMRLTREARRKRLDSRLRQGAAARTVAHGAQGGH